MELPFVNIQWSVSTQPQKIFPGFRPLELSKISVCLNFEMGFYKF